jgi:hypothetical protein
MLASRYGAKVTTAAAPALPPAAPDYSYGSKDTMASSIVNENCISPACGWQHLPGHMAAAPVVGLWFARRRTQRSSAGRIDFLVIHNDICKACAGRWVRFWERSWQQQEQMQCASSLNDAHAGSGRDNNTAAQFSTTTAVAATGSSDCNTGEHL